ncbi:unnamed protein product [Caenorhabditis auriculariae]|uniref:Dolichol-phosphate mannosyltransferase subunit 3 n=1 Tax=Caenorhabditis auriculariae TaxID=2777116 RepID=A0A8S1HPJ2_9PELO|nr:unnamed protein product [Caenorhabditis auriculariae]
MVSQLVTYLGHAFPLLSFWLMAVYDVFSVLSYIPKFLLHFVLYAPIYAIIGLGIYALFSVVYGVSKFNDCPEARKELVEEIKEARTDLKKRKVID